MRIGISAAAVLALASQCAWAAQTQTPQDPAEARIAFVKIHVADLEAAGQAYTRAFGMQDIGHIESAKDGIREITLKFGPDHDRASAGDNTGVVLVWRKGKALFHRTDTIPVMVLTDPDVGGAVKRAIDAGMTLFEPLREGPGFAAAMVRDQSGNVVEIIHIK